MGELTNVEYGQTDQIFALQRWVGIQGGTLHLLDPCTGERLRPDEPPTWLANDPRIAEGYEALGDPIHKHSLLIALGRHVAAKDLGKLEHRFAWFERTYANSDVVAFEEARGWDPAAWEDTIHKLRSQKRWQRGFPRSRHFGDRLLRATLRNPSVIDFSYDVEKTDRPIDKLLLEMINPESPDSRLKDMEFAERKVLHFAAGALREWYIPGKYMHELLKRNVPDVSRALLTIGTAHNDVPRKFSAFGFLPTVRRLPLSKKNRAQAEVYGEAMRTGSIDLQALGRLSLS